MVMSVRRNFVKTRGMPGDCLDCLGHSVAWDTRRVLAEMACEGNPSAALDAVLYLAVTAALRMRQAVAASGVCRSLDGSSGWLEMVRSRSKVRPDLSCLLVLWGKAQAANRRKKWPLSGDCPFFWGVFPEDYDNHKYQAG
ncbi:uncharacterized protein BO88DRAFT_443183 [Aspergillus vadensis CBS 113365]|uniref:Uncharacterized protein n=1 Tax=Aspergillus vadensis (strain CBS 113365 / IMI 142717 / IBT 24658) TaxID=1448311 RepID=A0A319BVC6_ASPVC|nr:hypothetical protein BO88DRAFT_443183 [Aspergillus vadensis CBS 113365]PYH69793.1 hypothetical protein BO88DRAFT_443183 [Aspergillus vadensis CBS 113365]